MCETGVSWPSLATEQDKSETGVSSPGPSTNPTHPRSPTRDSWNNSWDRYDYRDKWTDVWKGGHDGKRWIHGWNEHCHGDNWTDAWRERNSGFVRQHNDDNLTEAWNKCKPALFHKFGLKPRVIPGAKVLGKVEMPSGMGGVNGIVKYTVG